MPRLTGNFNALKLDLEGLKRDLRHDLTDILINGTQAWVRKVADIVPNWSGMSRASLQPIASLVGVPIFASPVDGAPNRVAAGRELAVPAPRLAIDDRGQYYFEWHTQVFHFIYNEFNNANLVGFHLRNPGPYHSMAQAEREFFLVVNPQLRAIQPNFDANIRVIRVQFR
jgi:hypothetical protein